MTFGGRKHDIETLRKFADGDLRQVWAADQAGDLHYLSDGEAAAMRPRARSGELQCPVPGCPDPRFTTRGGSRRDCFVHMGAGVGHTDTESVSHLQAKAMLAAWARTKAPQADVREERTLKDPATRKTRRPDVHVAWPSGPQVALEVEYKAYTVEDWETKQGDYDWQGVACSWLFGHLPRYLKPIPVDPDGSDGPEPAHVRIMTLPHAVATRGFAILHVNPQERLVGTVVVDGLPDDTGGWWRPERLPDIGRRLPREGDTIGRLVVCSIDDCRLDPTRGVVTPAMDQIAAEQEDRTKRARPLQEDWSRRERERLERARQAESRVERSRAASVTLRQPDPVSAARVAAAPPPNYHCIQCAYRENVGLPVTHPA